ncbi:MAG TPA: hypothetical protein VFJ53_05280 [Solirubrobacterales bacterium]|nr:hypothetical protein [Solirubrobacterales bacterium]
MFWGKKRRFIGAFAIAAAALLLALGGGAYAMGPVSVPLPTIETTFSSKITPRKLSSRGRVPVSLNLAESIRNRDGSHPPALQELGLDFDRHWELSVKGVPICGPHSSLQPREETISRCEDAKVGSGTLWVEVAFPEQAPVEISGSVNVYNFGVHDGRTDLLLYTYLHAPVTGAIAAPLKIRRRGNGIYGWEGTLSMPKIANGAGSVTRLSLNFDKGIFSAGCPTGKWQGRGDARFADGTIASSTLIQYCRTVASG